LFHLQQSFLLDQTDLRDATTLDIQERGAVYTRREVVEFILDLVGYTPDRPLATLRLLEPAVGQGDFLLPALARLLASLSSSADRNVVQLSSALCGVELHGPTFEATRHKVMSRLIQEGFALEEAEILADSWLVHGDFLLVPLEAGFHFVIGNPPYVRQELIPPALMAEYRARYRTIYDRADLYVPFIERSLFLLAEGGQLGFICADRWMKNRYGGPLRQLVAEHFHLKTYVNMVDTPAFHSDVIAYPAITIIARDQGKLTQIAYRPEISSAALTKLAAELTTQHYGETATVRSVEGIAHGAEPWIFDSVSQVQLVRRLEQEFPTLEEAGCWVGIGVATGADKAFIGRFDDLDVEDDRKLPLVMTRDILTGQVEWRGLGVINPFDEQGNLVKLAAYPCLQRYLEERREVIAVRHVAQKMPANWYRTIDRIYTELTTQPKLLIPDIKGEAHIVYEAGQYYPHHNLYFITSDDWDLRALQAVLRSGIASLFVSTYSTRMCGGYLRFQAQYLRRIRIPYWRDISEHQRQALILASIGNDMQACRQIVAAIYQLSDAEWTILEESVEGLRNAA
jgi:TaqI-like C-terminal specificity domain/Eco57I restriction-modification methylase